MNEEIQKRLTTVMDYIESSVATSKDFVVEQTPLVVQEFLAWEFWSNIIMGSIALLVTCIMLGFSIYGCVSFKRNIKEQYSPIFLFMIAIPLIVGTPFGLSASNRLQKALKVQIAPRVYLIEHVAELVKDIEK